MGQRCLLRGTAEIQIDFAYVTSATLFATLRMTVLRFCAIEFQVDNGYLKCTVRYPTDCGSSLMEWLQTLVTARCTSERGTSHKVLGLLVPGVLV